MFAMTAIVGNGFQNNPYAPIVADMSLRVGFTVVAVLAS